MKTEDKLNRLHSLLVAAVRKDPAVAAEVDKLFGAGAEAEAPDAPARPPRPRNRRAPAPFDPYLVYEQGEPALRMRLGELDTEVLKDIVAEYGMDAGKLVLKWKTKARILEHIVTTVQARAKKGDAFRS